MRYFSNLSLHLPARLCAVLFTCAVLLQGTGCDVPEETTPAATGPAPLAGGESAPTTQTQLAQESLNEPIASAPGALSQLGVRNYTYGYWMNGQRKAKEDASPEVLSFETGHYGFNLNMADFASAEFSRFEEPLSYVDALGAGTERMKSLQPAALEIELEARGKIFRAVSSKTGSSDSARPQVFTRMWESGRLAQRYDLLALDFEDESGQRLGVQGVLDVVAWPESLSFTAQLAPSLIYKDGWTQGVVDKGLCVIQKPWNVAHDRRLEHKTMTVEAWVKMPKELESGAWGYLLGKNKHEGHPGHFSFTYRHKSVTANMNFGGGGAGTRRIKQRGHAFKPDAWNHLALSYDGTAMHFYMNGQLQGSEVVEQERPLGDGELSLARRGGGSPILPAVFDQVRIWNRALTAQEIKAHARQPETMVSQQGLQYAENFDHYSKESIRPPIWQDVTMRIRLQAEEDAWEATQLVKGEWPLWESKTLHLNCDMTEQPVVQSELSIQVRSGEAANHPVAFDPLYNAYGVRVGRGQSKRSWNAGDPRKGGYDDYRITVENSGDEGAVAQLFFDLYDVAGITGATAMLCDPEGRPTGIPIQLSKNWHDPSIGQYIRCFTSLPVEPGTQDYLLRIAYGFYGSLPSASHAQLSLIGWGNHGRWDQLAIGTWGETICFDTDMSCVDVAITDVRMLMSRNGAEGKSWNWTDAGWGGDWLGIFDAAGKKLTTTEMKACYLSQGPCLTDVRFNGHYGAARQVAAQVDTSTLRTDDFARTFFKIRYEFDQDMPADKAWLFKIGRTGGSVSPKFAYGNAAGLIEELKVPVDLQIGQSLFEHIEPKGNAPWWAGFPGGHLVDGRDWGTGSRGLIVRSYRASLGGVTYDRPTFSTPVAQKPKSEGSNIDLLMTLPAGVERFQAGDTVEMEVEFITFHRQAEDYYGPNETYRQHLVEHPRSWKTIYREAASNALEVEVAGGELLSAYPIHIRATDAQIGIAINGGNGKVPLRIEGLPSAQGYVLHQIVDGQMLPLDQSVQGNDFWQTDYDQDSQTFRLTYNLPLDAGGVSRWVLTKQP